MEAEAEAWVAPPPKVTTAANGDSLTETMCPRATPQCAKTVTVLLKGVTKADLLGPPGSAPATAPSSRKKEDLPRARRAPRMPVQHARRSARLAKWFVEIFRQARSSISDKSLNGRTRSAAGASLVRGMFVQQELPGGHLAPSACSL